MNGHDQGCRAYGTPQDVMHLDVHHCAKCNRLALKLRLTEWVAIPEREPTP